MRDNLGRFMEGNIPLIKGKKIIFSETAKTNFNRKHWTTFFQSLLNERYNYNVILLKC